MRALPTTMVEDVKAYGKISGSDEDNLITALCSAAIELAETQTGKAFKVTENQPDSDIYYLALKMIVLFWYDNRGSVSDRTFNELPLAGQAILNHISLCSDYADLEESEETTT